MNEKAVDFLLIGPFPAVSVVSRPFRLFSGFSADVLPLGPLGRMPGHFGDCLASLGLCRASLVSFGGRSGPLLALFGLSWSLLPVSGHLCPIRWLSGLCTVRNGIKLMFTHSQYTYCGVQAVHRPPDGFSFLSGLVPLVLVCCLLLLTCCCYSLKVIREPSL